LWCGYSFGEGFTALSGGGTWVFPSVSPIGSGPYVTAAYVLSSTAGATSIVATIGANDQRGATFYEFSNTAGLTPILNSSGKATDSVVQINQPGVSLTTASSSDLIFQAYGAGALSSINDGYVGQSLQSGGACAYLLNASSGTAPTWTLTGASATTVLGLDFTLPVVHHKVNQN
jgi:hypothetical protein